MTTAVRNWISAIFRMIFRFEPRRVLAVIVTDDIPFSRFFGRFRHEAQVLVVTHVVVAADGRGRSISVSAVATPGRHRHRPFAQQAQLGPRQRDVLPTATSKHERPYR